MLAKIISAGALTLLLTGGALAAQPHKIQAGAQPHLQTSSCKQAFSLPKWQRANGECSGLNARASGSTISTLQRATSGHNDYVSHHDEIQRGSTSLVSGSSTDHGRREAAAVGHGQGFESDKPVISLKNDPAG
jgi:hypothetical protein